MQSILPCWRDKYVKQRKREDQFRNHYIYKKGKAKIENEFDAINLLKLLKQLKLLLSVLMNPTQKMLLGFQRKNVLDSDSSDHRSDDEKQLIQKLRSDNSFVKLMTLGKVKKDLQAYLATHQKLTKVDVRLL